MQAKHVLVRQGNCLPHEPQRGNLFVSKESTYCPLCFSWTKKDAPLGQDALAFEWLNTLLYAFCCCPWSLQHFSRSSYSLFLLVAPYWPERLWFLQHNDVSQTRVAPCHSWQAIDSPAIQVQVGEWRESCLFYRGCLGVPSISPGCHSN